MATSNRNTPAHRNTPANSPANQVAAFHQQTTLYQGAIPPPDMMEHYASIDPTFPSRLLAMAEQEGMHRRKLERSVIVKGFILEWGGLIAGLISVAAITFLSYQYLLKGSPSEGRWIAVGIMATLATVFVTRKMIPSKPQTPK